MKTKVVFRKFNKGGDIIAMFPQIPATRDGYLCESYQHIGQHGAADPMIVHDTTLAKPSEYASLLRELKSIGYTDLDIKQKMTYDDFKIRQREGKR